MAHNDDRDAMLRRGDELWEQLRTQLDARISQAAYGSHDWTGHDVYAHFARWQAHELGELRHLIAGAPLTPIEGDENEINDRWAAEDRLLTTEIVRERCTRTREEFRDALMTLTPAQWEAFGRVCSADINGDHYEHHLAALPAEAMR